MSGIVRRAGAPCRQQLNRRIARRSVRVWAAHADTAGSQDGVGSWFRNLLTANKAGGSALDQARRLVPQPTAEALADQRWALWWLLPLEPFSNRKTVVEEVMPGLMWTFEQLLGAVAIQVNQRMTVVKLADDGGLWVHNPVAPTPECLRLLEQLCAQHGPVKHIVCPTYAVEHKVYVGALAREFPDAELWVAPGLWSYPLNLPVNWQLGLPTRKVRVLDEETPSWADEFDHLTLGPLPLQIGSFVEVVFLHRASKTLLLTDLAVVVPEEPPAVCLADPTTLLYEARDTAAEPMENTAAARTKGWWKTALLALYIKPGVLDLRDEGFEWVDGWQKSFTAVAGRVLVAPLLSVLLLNRHPRQVVAWADRVALWDFTRVVPAHFAGPVSVTPAEFRRAFSFLETAPPPRAPPADGWLLRLRRRLGGDSSDAQAQLPVMGLDVDLEFLKSVNTFITEKGLASTPGELVDSGARGEP
jgi:hypothetical protein